jgi:hypothetical protein
MFVAEKYGDGVDHLRPGGDVGLHQPAFEQAARQRHDGGDGVLRAVAHADGGLLEHCDRRAAFVGGDRVLPSGTSGYSRLSQVTRPLARRVRRMYGSLLRARISIEAAHFLECECTGRRPRS